MPDAGERRAVAGRWRGHCGLLALALFLGTALRAGAAVAPGDYCVVGLGANLGGVADGWLALVTPAGAVTDLTPSLTTGLLNPWDCAIDPTTGDVILVDEGNTGNAENGVVYRVAVSGATVTQTVLHAGAPLINPRGVAVAIDGTLYIADVGQRVNNSIDGAVYSLVPGGSPTRLDTGGVGLANPTDLDLDPRPWTGASAGSNLILLEMRGGNLLRVPRAGGSVVSVATGPGGDEWRSLETGPYGNYFVTHREGRRVDRYDRLTGNRQTVATGSGGGILDRPQGVSVDYFTADLVIADEVSGVVNLPPNAYLAGAPGPTRTATAASLPGPQPAGIGFSPPLASASPNANFGMPTRRAPIPGSAYLVNGPAAAANRGDMEHEANFFIEVTSTAKPLRIRLFDPNTRNGYDQPLNASFTTSMTYRLYSPSGALLTAVSIPGNGRVDLDQRIATLNAGNTLSVRGPGVPLAAGAFGLYRLQVDGVTGNNPASDGDWNAFGLWVEDFHTYTYNHIVGPLFTQAGPPGLSPLDPFRLYPYVERGCEYTTSNFDADGSGTGLTIHTRLGQAFPLTLSGATVHAENAIDPSPAVPASIELDYGLHRYEGSLSPDATQNNILTVRTPDFQGWVDGGGAGPPVPVPPGNPAANPTPSLRTSPGPAFPQTPFGPATNSFLRHYLPRYDERPEAGASPHAPYLTQAATPINGDPPAVGVPARYVIQVTVVNPDPVNALRDLTLAAEVPAPAVYVDAGPGVSGGATATGGASVTTCGPAPCSGFVTASWANVPPASVQVLSYAVQVVATSAGQRLYLTGGPAVRGGGASPPANPGASFGTYATFTPAWSSAGFPRTESLGPLCDLSVVEGTVTPVAVELARFEARPGDGRVELVWETAAEFDNLGFYVYRRLESEPEFVRVSPELMLGRGTTDLSARYAFLDETVPNGVRAEYLLEDIEFDGDTTLHGPVAATPRAGLALAATDPALLAGYAELAGGAGPGPGPASPDPTDEPGAPATPATEDGTDPSALAAPSPDTGAVRVLQRDARSLVLEVSVPPLEIGTREVDGVRFTTVAAPGYGSSVAPGLPRLPTRVAWVEVADTPVVAVDVLEREGETRTLDAPVLPVAQPVLDGGTASGALVPDPEAYASTAPYPAGPLSLAGSVRLESGQRLLSLRIQPARYRAADRSLEVDRRVRLRLSLAGPVTSVGATDADTGAESRRAVAALAGVKLAVRGPALVRVPASELLEAGLEPHVDPRRLHVYRQGREIAVRVEGESDGRLDPGDALWLWSDGVDTRYTDEDVLFLVAGDRFGLRTPVVDAAPAGPAPPRSVAGQARFEEQRLYLPGILNGEGDNFVGRFVFNRAVASAIPSPGADGAPALLQVRLRGGTTYAAIEPDHHFLLRARGEVLADLRFDGSQALETWVELGAGRVTEETLSVELVPQFDSGAPFDLIYVDSFELHYRRQLELRPGDAGRLVFSAEEDGPHRIAGLADPARTALWDVSDPDEPQRLVGVPDGVGALAFQAQAGARYAVVEEAARTSASWLAPNTASTWSEAGGGADWVAIVHGSLHQEAERLAAHRERQGLRTAVIDVEDVYDEISGGLATPVAIRDFLRGISASWDPAPRHLLLVGEASYDYRDFLRGRAPNLVPTMLVDTSFVEAASDSWFGDLDDDAAPDLALGRIPARTPEELSAIVDKLLRHEAASEGDAPHAWRTRLLLVADDGLGAGDPREAEAFEGVLDGVREVAPPAFESDRLALRELPEAGQGEAARAAVRDALEEGRAFTLYAGHGGARLWADEGIFGADDVASLANGEALPLFLVLNCLNAFFDAPNEESLGEEALRAPDRGAAAFVSSTTVSAFTGQDAFARALAERLFAPEVRRVGEALLQAQQAIRGAAGAEDVLASFVLLGDPATTVALPRVPVADAGADPTVSRWQAVLLDGRASRSPSGARLRHRWQIVAEPRPGASTLVGANGPTPWFWATEEGDYRVALQVQDGRWTSASDVVQVRVRADGDAPFLCAARDPQAPPPLLSGIDLVWLVAPAALSALGRWRRRRQRIPREGAVIPTG